MGQVLHGSATTTEAIRRAIQHSQASLRALAKRYGINQKTVAKWKRRTSVADMPTGPKDRSSTVLTTEEEAVIVAFRKHTLLPLDDCLYALQPTIPTSDALVPPSLPAASWRQPSARSGRRQRPRRTKFKSYPIGFFHIDIAEVQTAQGKLYLFVAIDRTSKFAVGRTRRTRPSGRPRAPSWRPLSPPCPTGSRSCSPTTEPTSPTCQKNRSGPTAKLRGHPFRPRSVVEHGIEHRLTKPNHPWTNGQVERMNRTIKDATVKRYHYETHDQLVRHLDDFVAAYNFARRLKTLNGLTPYEFICKRWTIEPERFRLNPLQQMPGLNI